MFVVMQSDTGQYVITHPPTNTVMVGDDLAATYERMRAAVVDKDEATTQPSLTTAKRIDRTWARPAAIAAIAALPFLWLGALHLSLGRLAAELRAPAKDASDRADLEARVDRLERGQARPEGSSKKHRKKSTPKPEEPAAVEAADEKADPKSSADRAGAAAKDDADDLDEAE